jgi:hypothetical protein
MRTLKPESLAPEDSVSEFVLDRDLNHQTLPPFGFSRKSLQFREA